MTTRQGFFFLLAIGLTTPAVFAGPPLAYRLAQGDTFDLVTSLHAEVPVRGTIDSTVTAHSQVISCSGDQMSLKESITSHVEGKPDRCVDISFGLSPEGGVCDLCGIDPSDTTGALIAKNAAGGLPPLPNAPVDVGSAWEDERVLYLPSTPIPGVPDSLRLHTAYTVKALDTASDAPCATVGLVVTQSPGQKITVNASGTMTVSLATGKLLKSHVEGKASLRVIFRTFEVPMALDAAMK